MATAAWSNRVSFSSIQVIEQTNSLARLSGWEYFCETPAKNIIKEKKLQRGHWIERRVGAGKKRGGRIVGRAQFIFWSTADVLKWLPNAKLVPVIPTLPSHLVLKSISGCVQKNVAPCRREMQDGSDGWWRDAWKEDVKQNHTEMLRNCHILQSFSLTHTWNTQNNKNKHTQKVWEDINPILRSCCSGPQLQVCLSSEKGLGHLLAGREPSKSLRAPRLEPSSWGRESGAGGGCGFCPDALTKDTQTNNPASTFSIFTSEIDRQIEAGMTGMSYSCGSKRPATSDLVQPYFASSLDCAAEHVWRLRKEERYCVHAKTWEPQSAPTGQRHFHPHFV